MLRSRPRLRLALTLAAVLLPGVILAPVWRLGGLGPGEDDILYYFPSRTFFHDALRSGELPTLNPWTGLGRPFLADPQSAVWYPGTWLFALLSPQTAYPASLWLHFSLALIGGYRLLRWQRLPRSAAALGGVVFAFGGFMLAHRVHFAMQHSAAWTPWVFWRLGRLAESLAPVSPAQRVVAPSESSAALARSMFPRIPRRLASAALAAALQVLAGHVQIAALTALGALVWLLAAHPARLRIVAGVALTWLLAAMLAGVQLLPTTLYLRDCTRIEQGYWDFTQNSWHPAALVNFVLPMFLGQRTPNLFDQPYWGPSHQVEQFGYVGLLPLVLVLAAGPAVAWRSARGRAWLLLLGFALLLAAGKYGPVCPLLYLAPGSQIFRVPARALLLVNLALAGLAALSFARLMRAGQSPPESSTASTAALASTSTHAVAEPGIAAPGGSELRCDDSGDSAVSAAGSESGAVSRGPAGNDRRIFQAWLGLALLAVAGLIVAAGLATFGPEPLSSAARASLRFTNPAILVPLALGALTATALALFRRRPAGNTRLALVFGVLLLDLAVIGFTLDVPRSVTARAQLLPSDDWSGWQEKIRASGLRLWVVTPRSDSGPGEYIEPTAKLVANVNLLRRLPALTDYGPLQPRSYARAFEFEPWGEARDPLGLLASANRLDHAAVGWVLVCDPALPPPAGGVLAHTTRAGWRLYQRPARMAWWQPAGQDGRAAGPPLDVPVTSPTLGTRRLDIRRLPPGVAGEVTVSLLNIPGWRSAELDIRNRPDRLLLSFPFTPDGRDLLELRYHTPGLAGGAFISLLGCLLLAGLLLAGLLPGGLLQVGQRVGGPLARFTLRRL